MSLFHNIYIEQQYLDVKMYKTKSFILIQCVILALVSPSFASYAGSGSSSAAAMPQADLPAGFDVKAYVSLNPDLQDYINRYPADIAAAGGPDKWATNHYLSYGKNEGRNFKKLEGAAAAPVANLPAGFDAKTYVSLNPDLDQFIKDHAADIAAAGGADKWATNHYLSHGKNEGRNFKKMEAGAAPVASLPEGFDVKAYVSLNPDLDQYIKDHPADITAAGGADKWAINHYLNNGKNEGRNFKMEGAAAPKEEFAAKKEEAKLNAKIPFNRDVKSPITIGKGWSDQQEERGIWSDGGRADFTIQAPNNPGQDRELVINGGAFLNPNTGNTQIVQVTINGQDLSDLTYTPESNGEKVITIPKGLIKNGIIKVIFKIEYPVSPASLSGGVGDPRMLGLAIRSLELRAAGAGAAAPSSPRAEPAAPGAAAPPPSESEADRAAAVKAAADRVVAEQAAAKKAEAEKEAAEKGAALKKAIAKETYSGKVVETGDRLAQGYKVEILTSKDPALSVGENLFLHPDKAPKEPNDLKVGDTIYFSDVRAKKLPSYFGSLNYILNINPEVSKPVAGAKPVPEAAAKPVPVAFAIPELSKDKVLLLEGMNLSEDNIMNLTQHWPADIQALHLFKTTLTPKGMKILMANLPKGLRAIRFEDFIINDALMAAFALDEKLRIIYFKKSELTDDSLQLLIPKLSPELEYLNLSDNKLSDRGILLLIVGMKAGKFNSLKKLSLDQNKISGNGIIVLVNNLPKSVKRLQLSPIANIFALKALKDAGFKRDPDIITWTRK